MSKPKPIVVEQPLLEGEMEGASPQPRFEEDVAIVLNDLRRAFGQLLESLPGTIRGAGDVQRVLGLDKALSWQVYRVGSVTDPIAAAPDMPRPAGVERAIRAAAGKRVAQAVLVEVRGASERYEALVERHAGDRGLFDAMARGLRTDAGQVHLKERRATFRGNTALWGVQAQTHYNLSIFHPGANGQEDSAQVVGFVGLRKLRVGAHGHVIGRRTVWSTTPDGHGVPTPMARRTVDILEQFSTSPLPPLRTREVEAGRLETVFESDTVGKAGEVTYFVRDVGRAIGTMPQPWWGSISLSRLPTEVAIVDMLIPAGWASPRSARVETYGNLRNYDRAWDRNDEDRLPVTEQIEHLGTNTDLLRTPHVPKCPEIVAFMLGEMGWEKTSFDIFRCVVQYPILCAGVATRVDAVVRPGERDRDQ